MNKDVNIKVGEATITLNAEQLASIDKQRRKNVPVMERIKTYEDACADQDAEVLTLKHFSFLPAEDQQNAFAHHKLNVIAKSLNEGWTPDWTNSNESKYTPWFQNKSGVGFSCRGCDNWRTSAGVGSRLCFKSSELSEYAGKQFIKEYNYFLSK